MASSWPSTHSTSRDMLHQRPNEFLAALLAMQQASANKRQEQSTAFLRMLLMFTICLVAGVSMLRELLNP